MPFDMPEGYSGRTVSSYSVPCDHIPIRSWPLFRARELMRMREESFKREQSL
jgi:hypothetical protein